jgi:hypothetical protein
LTAHVNGHPSPVNPVDAAIFGLDSGAFAWRDVLVMFTPGAAMLTYQIDAALDALLALMMRAPALRDCYRPGTPERTALDELLAQLAHTDAILFNRAAADAGCRPA